MALLILIPTFQRPTSLYWSIDSVLKQNLQKNVLNSKIIILNNDSEKTLLEVSCIIDKVVKNNPTHTFDSIEVIQGDSNVNPIKNIFGIIKENTISNDVSIIHCDDDIMLPDTLYDRYLKTISSDFEIIISQFVESVYFFINDENIYLNLNSKNHLIDETFNKAVTNDLINYSIPFLSVYTYKISETFWEIYDQTISWADDMPYEPKIKYPFIPFYIGLSAYNKNKLATYNRVVVIRGHLFKLNFFYFPSVVTEYVNAGIILLTGESVLRNKDLIFNKDFDQLRSDFKSTVDNFILQTLFKRGGVRFNELYYLFKTTNRRLNIKTYISNINFNSLRNLFNNVIFDTRYFKNFFIGWGIRLNRVQFYKRISP